MEFHISRSIRQKTGMDGLLFAYTGNVLFGDLRASREFALRYNKMQSANDSDGEQAKSLHAGALFAMGLIDELNHAMIARYRATQDPDLFTAALKWFESVENRTAVDDLLHRFTDRFPSVFVYRGEQSVTEWLDSNTSAAEAGADEDVPNREAAVEELLMLWLANTNPAFAEFRELFDDRPLANETIYRRVATELPRFFETRPRVSTVQGSLLDLLQAPMKASPTSLSGQLAFMREEWAEHLGSTFSETLRRTLLAVDVLQEEAIALWMTFHPDDATVPRGEGLRQAEGFVGDEFVGFNHAADFGSQVGGNHAPEQPLPLNEFEAFSQDQSWMPTVVLIAKSTYVWLEQLSKKYLRHINRLDQIPDEELALLASRGINGLWLIGLWERSTASQTIKRLRGQPDAVASAYSLKDYRIAEDLGGDLAYQFLRDRAAHHGIRLASDMVPNHMGIDSTWVMEHPEWFLARSDSPYPVYSFSGPDLSTESRFEIKIEDHYYDQSDAAVVFRLCERSNGETRFVYHGNDGTTFAWNDTAQLDYSKAAVREHVIQTILNVARQFPIIRFDAAMTLAKKHVQRLWFPLPGIGGSIPSRAESAISQAQFDALMPDEFWREVVDRVAAEVPGTLLLAEAFWLLEGYFVRTLGMHRVYNSAFMNMLRDEENAKYRSYLKKTIEFDPDILKRYVNFMSNPDERTAIDQFGSGDKYFGTCTMLGTLPGLPMFGHGQIEAFTEKYGMEYKQARLAEWPNDDLIARHQREIAPLLKNRQLFAESHNFVLYDLWRDSGDVDENVFVYSNRVDHGECCERALIFYNNTYASTHGTIDHSVAAMDKGSGVLTQRRLSEALRLRSGSGTYLAWRDTASNLEYLRRADDLHAHGFSLSLRGYQYAVLLDWRELVASEEQPWDRLSDALNGAGVYSLDGALSQLRLRPLHEALRAALSPDVLESFAQIAREALQDKALPTTTASADLLRLTPASVGIMAASAVEKTEHSLELPDDSVTHSDDRSANDVSQSTLGGTTEEAISEVADAVVSCSAEVVRSPEAKNPLERFLNCAEHFLGLLNEACIAGDESLPPPQRQSDAPPTFKAAAAVPSAAERFASRALCLARLPLLESRLSESWQQTIPAILPNAVLAVSWAPAIAWLLIEALDPEPTSPSLATHAVLEAFDDLHLRAALAEIFRSLGIEGEDAWRAAARIRVLLAHRRRSSVPPSEAFSHEQLLASDDLWADPDLRWLTALNESNGRTYLNRECLNEMVWWLAVPDLLSASSEQNEVAGDSLTAIEERIHCHQAAALKAGYDLELFQQLLRVPDLIENDPQQKSDLSGRVDAPDEPASTRFVGDK